VSLSITFWRFQSLTEVSSEDHDHERQTEYGLGPEIGHVRHSAHLHLDWKGDLLLHLFRGTPRPLGNDRYVVVGDVGIRFHR
jgi:hypothetical protein